MAKQKNRYGRLQINKNKKRGTVNAAKVIPTVKEKEPQIFKKKRTKKGGGGGG